MPQNSSSAKAEGNNASLPAVPRKATPSESLLAGAVAGMVSRLFVAPLDVIKIRFQTARDVPELGRVRHYTGILHAMRTIAETEGVLVCISLCRSPAAPNSRRSPLIVRARCCRHSGRATSPLS